MMKEYETANVKIINAVMAAGKTTHILKTIEESPATTKWLFVTPFLSECERVRTTIKTRQFMEPNYSSGGKKLDNLKRLLMSEADIVTTHALFHNLDDEAFELIKLGNYALVLDEVVTPFTFAQFELSDIRTLLKSELIEIDDASGQIIWTDDSKIYERGRYSDIKKSAQAGTLYYLADKYLVNAIDTRLFTSFNDCYVLTYLFECSLLRYYFDIHSLQYETLTMHNGELVPYKSVKESRSKFKELIRIYDGHYNDIGKDKTSFCRSWLDNKSDDEIKTYKDRLYSFVKHITGAKSKEVIWTCLKDYKPKLAGKGYTKGYAPVNARATNEYSDRNVVMYCYSRYLSPHERQFFYANDVKVDEDSLALSDMLQFIWRSAIRKGEPITVFIPSARMRGLLQQWLDNEI